MEKKRMDPQIHTESETYTCKLFTVKKINVTLPDGKDKVYEMIDIQNAVTLLPIDDENNLYFVEQFRIGSKSKLLELPAGKIEAGEDPLLTARRELREEIGMDARKIIPLGNFYMSPGYANEYMYCYLAEGLFRSPLTPDADEFIDLQKIPLARVQEMVENGEIEDSKTLAVLQLAAKHLRQG
jgi:ADP-ribose pyrophosphatase